MLPPLNILGNWIKQSWQWGHLSSSRHKWYGWGYGGNGFKSSSSLRIHNDIIGKQWKKTKEGGTERWAKKMERKMKGKKGEVERNGKGKMREERGKENMKTIIKLLIENYLKNMQWDLMKLQSFCMAKDTFI